ncbi:hypothetical protein Tco_0686292 [Tanacetum coccineum]
MGFINGTCNRSAYLVGASLLEQYDSCNVVVLNWILSSLSQVVYLGHVFFDNATNVWNELKETYDRVDGSIARAELTDHGKLLRLMQFLMDFDDVYQAIRSSILTKKILPKVKDAFVIVNSGNWSNGNGSRANKGNYDRSNNAHAKGGFMGNNDIKSSLSPLSLSNEHILKLMSLLNDKSYTPAKANMAVDVSDLKLIVGHPIDTLAKITHVGFKRGEVLGTGSEFTRLYLFNKEYNVSASVNKSEYFACHVSKDVWHNRLGHPGFLPLSEVESVINVTYLNFFDFVTSETASKTHNLRPNDDEEGTPLSRDGSLHQPGSVSDDQSGSDDQMC